MRTPTRLLPLAIACAAAPALADHTRNILLTGYWLSLIHI